MQKPDDYWPGLSLQIMDISAIQLVQTNDQLADDTTPCSLTPLS
jgi:hypothetical protein